MEDCVLPTLVPSELSDDRWRTPTAAECMMEELPVVRWDMDIAEVYISLLDPMMNLRKWSIQKRFQNYPLWQRASNSLCSIPFSGQGFTFTIKVIRAGQPSRNILECHALLPEKVFVVFPCFIDIKKGGISHTLIIWKLKEIKGQKNENTKTLISMLVVRDMVQPCLVVCSFCS